MGWGNKEYAASEGTHISLEAFLLIHSVVLSWRSGKGDLMATQKPKRKLTAILSADVKGYSRLMGEDEMETTRTVSSLG